MATLNFPLNPTLNDTYTFEGKTWTWNGYAWKLNSASYFLDNIKTVDGTTSGLDADLLDGQHGSYYTDYTDTAIANLVDTAPSTLDTLNELAAALGDDPNFATTVTNSIATKWTQDNTKISNWDTAYSWGDHGVAGYAQTSLTVAKDSATGAAQLPSGTEAERPSGTTGQIRFNTDAASFEGYNGTEWGALGGGGGSMIVSETAPTDPDDYAIWFNSTTGKKYTYYVDADSSQWVEL